MEPLPFEENELKILLKETGLEEPGDGFVEKTMDSILALETDKGLSVKPLVSGKWVLACSFLIMVGLAIYLSNIGFTSGGEAFVLSRFLQNSLLGSEISSVTTMTIITGALGIWGLIGMERIRIRKFKKSLAL